jgi:hypothetical protein
MNQKIEYGTASQAITLSLAPAGVGLINGAARESTAIDNTTNKFIDAIVYLAIKLAAGSPASEKVIKIYFAASEDGTNYTYNATGSDSGITMVSPADVLGPFIIQAPNSGAVVWKAVFPVAQFFGGILPPKWSIILVNNSGLALDGTEGSHTKEYRGVFYTVS